MLRPGVVGGGQGRRPEVHVAGMGGKQTIVINKPDGGQIGIISFSRPHQGQVLHLHHAPCTLHLHLHLHSTRPCLALLAWTEVAMVDSISLQVPPPLHLLRCTALHGPVVLSACWTGLPGGGRRPAHARPGQVAAR